MVSAVRSLSERDIPDVLSIQKSRSIAQTTDYTQGFLVHLATREEIAVLLEEGKGIALVSENEDRIDSYCLAYKLDEWKKLFPEWANNVSLNSPIPLEPTTTLYFRHIATRKNATAFDQVVALECELIAQAKQKEYEQIIGEIVCEPMRLYNERSFRLHKAMGYGVIGSVTYPSDVEGMRWSLLHRNIRESD